MTTYLADVYIYTPNFIDTGGPFVAGTTITDTTDDGEFVVNEGATDNGGAFVGTATYIGTINLGGTVYPVFEEAGPTYYVAAAPGSTYPANNGDPLPSVTAENVCFAAGTLIATPEGVRAVETLQTGDLVTTADGRAVPVRWVGRQTMHRMFSGPRAVPVRVTTGALGGGLPHSDLVLTADHALILDGCAVNAGALVNGSSIVWATDVADRATYYHVETDDHDVILANGVPAETYVDYIARRCFDNHAEYLALYGEERTVTEMTLPRVSSARLLPDTLRARLAAAVAA